MHSHSQQFYGRGRRRKRPPSSRPRIPPQSEIIIKLFYLLGVMFILLLPPIIHDWFNNSDYFESVYGKYVTVPFNDRFKFWLYDHTWSVYMKRKENKVPIVELSILYLGSLMYVLFVANIAFNIPDSCSAAIFLLSTNFFKLKSIEYANTFYFALLSYFGFCCAYLVIFPFILAYVLFLAIFPLIEYKVKEETTRVKLTYFLGLACYYFAAITAICTFTVGLYMFVFLL